MPDKVDDALVVAMARVQLAQSRIQAFLYALEGIDQKDRVGAIEAAADKIYRQLVDGENDAYRRLFMLSLLGTKQDRLAAAELALERFMGDKVAIMTLLRTTDTVYGWFTDEERKFRADIAARMELVRRDANDGNLPK